MNDTPRDAQSLADAIEQTQAALRSCDKLFSTSQRWPHKAAASPKPKTKRQPRSSRSFEKSWSPSCGYLSSR